MTGPMDITADMAEEMGATPEYVASLRAGTRPWDLVDSHEPVCWCREFREHIGAGTDIQHVRGADGCSGRGDARPEYAEAR